MLKPAEAKADEARKQARELFQRERAKESEVIKEREKLFTAQAEKTAKFRALRLARDAAAEAAAAAEPPAPKKTAKPRKASA